VNSATSISGTLTGNPMTLSAYNPMGTGSPQPISGNTIAQIEGQRQDQLSLALSSSNGNINFSGTIMLSPSTSPLLKFLHEK